MEIFGVTALTMIITQVIKKAFALKTNIVPLISLCIGVIIVAIMFVFTEDAVLTWEAIVNTLIAIGAANGFYSGVRASFKK